jgi:sulfoxide reductase heme-binding subunit YedZ
LPAPWQRSAAVYPVLALLAGATAAGIEFAWYGLATHVNPWRVLNANATLAFGPRPAHLVAAAALGLSVLILARRIRIAPRLWLRLFSLRAG